MKFKSVCTSLLSLLSACGLYAANAAAQAGTASAAGEAMPAAEAAVEPVPAEYASDWHFSAGVSYRNFRSPRFKSSAKTSSFQGYLVNEDGSVVAPSQDNMADAWSAAGGSTQQPGVRRFSFADYQGGRVAAAAKGDYGKGEEVAPLLSVGTDFWSNGRLAAGFVANFQFFNLDTAASMRGAGTGSLTGYDKFVSYNPANGYVFNDQHMSYTGPDILGVANTVSARTKFDMQLYVFDLGLSLGYDFDCGVRAYVAAGPSLSVADMESSTRATSFSSVGEGGTVRGRDNSVEFNWGVYASAGASYWFSETYGLAAEVRYDNGFGDVSTHYAKQSLDSWGGVIKLSARF